MRHAVVLVLVLALAACGRRADGPPEGRQGTWARLASTTSIVVESATLAPADDAVLLTVAWRLENTGPGPEVFRWKNKVVIAPDGRRYGPIEGQDTPLLAPGARSPLLYNRYRLPARVTDGPLWWGLYTDGRLQYRISLTPAR